MIRVTDRAKKELKQILSNNVDWVFASLRLLDRGQGVLGVGIDIELPGDHIIEYEGTNLLLVEPELIKKFQEAYGSAICKDIQTHCLGFPTEFIKEGKFDKKAFDKFEAHGGHELVAPTVVGRAAAWAVEILWDELPKDQDIDLSDIPSWEEAEKELNDKIANL